MASVFGAVTSTLVNAQSARHAANACSREQAETSPSVNGRDSLPRCESLKLAHGTTECRTPGPRRPSRGGTPHSGCAVEIIRARHTRPGHNARQKTLGEFCLLGVLSFIATLAGANQVDPGRRQNMNCHFSAQLPTLPNNKLHGLVVFQTWEDMTSKPRVWAYHVWMQ